MAIKRYKLSQWSLKLNLYKNAFSSGRKTISDRQSEQVLPLVTWRSWWQFAFIWG